MSRIFDALRRSEQERTGRASAKPAADSPSWQDLVESIESRTGTFEQVAHVECSLRPESHVVAHTPDQNPGAEKFRVLAHRLNQLRQRRPLSRLLVTSSIPKEGKTVVTVNLVATLARSSTRVALIDADIRQPGVSRVLGLPQMPGLADFLEGRLDLSAGFRVADPLGIFYLPAGHSSLNPVELLQSSRMNDLMAQVTAAFDWVVFDSPPLNPFADAQRLASLTDGVVLVVRSGVTPKDSAVQGLSALNGAYVAGVVLNAYGEPGRDDYYYYYYGRSSEAKA